jgi:hypothetical protein
LFLTTTTVKLHQNAIQSPAELEEKEEEQHSKQTKRKTLSRALV